MTSDFTHSASGDNGQLLPRQVKKHLLSARFTFNEVGGPSLGLSPDQLECVRAFRERLASGAYRLISAPCPCGTPGDETVIAEIDRHGLPLRSVLCSTCGAVRSDPYLDDKSLASFYTELYQAMYARLNSLPGLFAFQRGHGERLLQLYKDQLTPSSTVLEIGCGTGGSLAAFRDAGYQTAGCDYGQELIAYGMERGLPNLWLGTIDDAPREILARRHDLIYLQHVFEHVQHPRKTLECLRDRLASNGRILLVVPDLARIDSHRNPAGDALQFFHVAHKFNFTAESLAAIGFQVGLRGARIEPPPRKAENLPPAEDFPELWFEYSLAAAPAKENDLGANATSQSLLTYLLQTEQAYLARRARVCVAHSKEMPTRVYYVGAPADMAHHARPLTEAFDLKIVSHEEVVRVAEPGSVCIFYNEYFPHFREACLELKQKQCATLYAIDGILEWRNSWELPDTGLCCPWVMRPALSHKIACIGRSQARVLRSWGNLGQCEVVGLPRCDRFAHCRPRRRGPGEPLRVLVLTAKCPAFDREQMIRTKQSLLDLKAWFDTHPRVAGIAVRSVWRLTYGLEELIGVDNELNDTTGQDLAAVLETVDAVITTPSTAMLEGMLQGLPVALLDYHNRPHYVPAAWQITAVQQIDQILSELLAPDTARMLYQRSILHDALECQSPATSRLVQLVAAMQRIAHDCVSRGAALEFPAQILDGASNEPCLPDGLFDPVHLFPRQPQFAQNDTRALQAAAAHYQELASSWEQQCQQHLSQLQELHMAAEQQLEKNSQNWQLVLEENSANWQRVVDENSANWQRVLDENSANWQRELAARPILNASRSYPA